MLARQPTLWLYDLCLKVWNCVCTVCVIFTVYNTLWFNSDLEKQRKNSALYNKTKLLYYTYVHISLSMCTYIYVHTHKNAYYVYFILLLGISTVQTTHLPLPNPKLIKNPCVVWNAIKYVSSVLKVMLEYTLTLDLEINTFWKLYYIWFF